MVYVLSQPLNCERSRQLPSQAREIAPKKSGGRREGPFSAQLRTAQSFISRQAAEQRRTKHR